MPAGMACAPSGDVTMGAWVRLPTVDECSAATDERASAGTQLLGWATTPSFPTDLAREHVADSDTAMELRDDTNHITAVFIPAGGWAHITAGVTLYPIWV